MFLATERMMFDLKQSRYELNETSWGWEESDGVELPNEGVYHLKNGAVTGCVAHGCKSCALCDDGTSIKADCGDDKNWKGDGHVHHYFPRPKVRISKGYVGGLSHSFEFGEITAAEGVDGASMSTQATEMAAVTTASASSGNASVAATDADVPNATRSAVETTVTEDDR